MKWRGRQQSSNISNRGRGRAAATIGGGGLLLGLVVLLLTGDPMAALNAGLGGGGGRQVQTQSVEMSPRTQELYDYSAVVLKDTEDAWSTILPEYDVKYREPKLVIFTDTVESGCGIAQKGMGPFYCSKDESIYMDLTFYDDLTQKFGADEGDFIMSYVIAHEVGHHVQNITGVLDQVNQKRTTSDQNTANELTVRLELQADYLAGVSAKYQADQGYLEKGDIEEAISTAWSIGDDTIQKRTQGHVDPESFTHGTSEQRTRWYKKGYENGDLSEWDTFATNNL